MTGFSSALRRISIHALREEGDVALCPNDQRTVVISIHALREEGDRIALTSAFSFSDFYPRPPRGGRPYDDDHVPTQDTISIHALREEGDSFASSKLPLRSSFLSTPSARRATLPKCHKR